MDKESIYKTLLSDLKAPESCSKSESWQKLQNRIQESEKAIAKPETKVVSMNRRLIWVAAAASIFLAGLFFFDGGEVLHQSTIAGEHREITLPDGSIIWLNSNSQLDYKEATWGDDRLVNLHGEAYFQVSPGGDFEVHTDHGVVHVKGTSFNVFARNDFEVFCSEGNVEVDCKGERVLLSGGSETEMDATGLADIQTSATWKDWRQKEYYYTEENIARVLDEIERQFGVDVEYPEDIQGKMYSGPLNTSDLNQSLQTVCLSMGMDFDFSNPSKISIKKSENNQPSFQQMTAPVENGQLNSSVPSPAPKQPVLPSDK